MPAIEIQPIKKSVNIHVSGSKVVLPEPLRQKINQHWQQLVKDNPRLHNGESFTVVAVDETDDRVDIELAETDYAHYLYSHQIGGLGEFTVRIIHSATLVITADNKMIFGAMGEHTSRPGIIQCCGGGIDHNDITDDVVDIEHNTVKELGEELGLNPYDKNIVDSFSPAYLKTGGPTGKMTLAYILHLKQSSSQFLQHYQEFVKKLEDDHQEPEFGQIFCIDIDKQSVEAFIGESENKLNEYMPVLLRAAVSMSDDNA
jgi:hypothetical protein